MHVMSSAQVRVDASALGFAAATAVDAEAMVQLYQDVYRGSYPCPGLFTMEGMAEYLNFARSRTTTILIKHGGELVGCLSCELKGRAAYVRGGMIAPAWQGRVSAKATFQRVLLEFRRIFAPHADYFYGEARTETAKFHTIFDELGWRPLAILPCKDVFFDRRESELIYAWHYREPRLGPLHLTPTAAYVASEVMGRLVPPASAIATAEGYPAIPDLDVEYTSDPNGDGHLHLSSPAHGEISALVCPASRNAEKVVARANSPGGYRGLVRGLLAELHRRHVEYVEVYAPAGALSCQTALEDLGFAPTGFLPAWYAPGEADLGDYLVYAKHYPSILPECPPKFTPSGEYLRLFVPPASAPEELRANVVAAMDPARVEA